MTPAYRTPAALRWPKSQHVDWLRAMDEWSATTGVDLGTLHDHEIPCADCGEIIDCRDLASVFAHEHTGEEMEFGKYMGEPVLDPDEVM